MYYIFLSQWSIEGHLGCFHVLVTTVNSAAMHIGAHVSFRIGVFVFSGYIPRSEIVGLYGSNIDQSLMYNGG